MNQTIKQTLYDRDFDLWVADTVAKLKARQFGEIDLENLIEEIESLAKRDRRELENRLDVLLNHLLKRCYINSPEDYRGWEITIREQRKQLQRLLKQSPSLKTYFAEVFDEVWRSALNDAQQDYPQVEFPIDWPFSREIDAVLGDRFWQD